MVTTLEEAKQLSLRKWRAIKADLPNIKTSIFYQPDDRIYGGCGLCSLYLDSPGNKGCSQCGLKAKSVCCNWPDPEFLYWKICSSIEQEETKKLPTMVDQMIKAIEEL